MHKHFFASDNCASVHPKVFEQMMKANDGHAISYGDDLITKKATDMIRSLFQKPCEVYFVVNGTGANVTALTSSLKSYGAVICPETAHINTDECGAFEKFTGAKIYTVPSNDGKLNLDVCKVHLHNNGVEHHNQPAVISITQSTEFGTLYTVEEITAIADFAHQNGMYLHMDGARISNAVAACGQTISELTCEAGVDMLSFGGAKNGLMFGEAVVIFDQNLAKDFKYVRKQSMQLMSKMRFIAAQYIAFLEDDLYIKNAAHANSMAKLLAKRLNEIGVEIVAPVQVNAVFAKLNPTVIPLLQAEYYFYVWNTEQSVVRLMTPFDISEEDINGFISVLQSLMTQ